MAKIIYGKDVATVIQEKLKEDIKKFGLCPNLAIVQIGNREDSNVYIKMKIKFAQEVGAQAQHFKLPKTTTEVELIKKIDELNKDEKIHGIIVQLPFDSEHKINIDLITNLILPHKDVDGLTDINAGKLLHGQIDGKNNFLPCTPFGCFELIKASKIQIAGSKAVVLGRSKIVGSPMAQLLVWNNATVTIVHSKSKDIDKIVKESDIVVAAIGQPHFVKKEWIKPGAVVIDCGITAIPDKTKKSGQKLVGDVEPSCKEVASAITPVPGGVGPMTVAMLIKNTVEAAKKIQKAKTSNKE